MPAASSPSTTAFQLCRRTALFARCISRRPDFPAGRWPGRHAFSLFRCRYEPETSIVVPVLAPNKIESPKISPILGSYPEGVRRRQLTGVDQHVFIVRPQHREIPVFGGIDAGARPMNPVPALHAVFDPSVGTAQRQESNLRIQSVANEIIRPEELEREGHILVRKARRIDRHA